MNVSKSKFPWLYLLLAYGIAWLFWIPVALAGQDFRTSPLLMAAMLLGTFGPGIAGIILTYREGSRETWRDFWKRVVDFRQIRLPWYLGIFLLFPVLQLLAVAVNSWMGARPPEFAFVKQFMSQPGTIMGTVVLYVLQAALEELGWRGYMLDRLQARWKPLSATLILGIYHTFWSISSHRQPSSAFSPTSL